MRLDAFDTQDFDRGSSRLVEALWLAISWLFVDSWLPGSALRAFWLRLFGARIGGGARLKPRLRVKFPWRLAVGDHVWLGEGVWIDNLAPVTVGDHCCISQGAYLCTGSHDWSRADFALTVAPITLEDQCWVGARAVLGPGITVHQGAVLGLGGIALTDLEPWSVYLGNPATKVRSRHEEPATARAES
jgi:putative colanic acid biosynthesis acetyltransferase WcaF